MSERNGDEALAPKTGPSGVEAPQGRQAPRRDVQRRAWVTFGIDAAHHFLEAGAGVIGAAIRSAEALRADPRVKGMQHGFEPWSVINESVSGFLLAGPDGGRGEPHLGELLGVVLPSPHAQPRLSAAALRWLRAGADTRVEMGVEIIPGTPRPVRCTGAGGDTVAGLYFPSTPALELPPTLVLPTGIYVPGATMCVEAGERALRVRAGTLVTQTDCFERFDVETD